MIDIVSVREDIGLFDTDTEKAKNILSVQLGALEYAPDLGIDLKFFLNEGFSFQNESFRAYLIETLANNRINVASVVTTVETLVTKYQFNIAAQDNTGGLIAR